MTILVVGGSLCGLTFALACANRGIATRVVERAPRHLRNGGCLGVNRKRILEVVGIADDDLRASSFPRPVGERHAVSWSALQSWLLELAAEKSEITLESNVTVVRATTDDDIATIETSTGRRLMAPLIVGADGQCSVIRQAVDPGNPAASFAGYILWRGLIPEASLPASTDPARLGENVSLVTRNGHRLVAFPVADIKGSTRVGERFINVIWYDPSRFDLLRELGCLDEQGNVLRPPRPNEIPHRITRDLLDFANQRWPEPWRTVIRHAIESGLIFAYPVAEYYPNKLQAGRMVLIGDAAHVCSPVTEQGFAAGVEDAAILLASAGPSFCRETLKAFEAARLPSVQRLVASSRAWSRKYLAEPVRACSQPARSLLSSNG